MNYTLHQLQIFLKVAQTQSVTRAAEELFLSQPAVSIQLRNFQAQFVQSLTEVVGRKIYLTDFGKEIARSAEAILNEVSNLNHLARTHEGQLHGTLKLAAVSTGNAVMPRFLAAFLQQHPGVELHMDVTNRAKVLQSLEKNEVDFALVSILPTAIKVESLSLMENRLFLIGPPGSRSGAEALPATALAQLPLIYRELGSGTRATMEQFITKSHVQVSKQMELNSNEAVKHAVIAGLGYSIMPLIGIRAELTNGELCIIPMKGLPLVTTWQLIWLKDKQLSPVALAYWNFIATAKEQIMRDHFTWMDQY